MAISAAGTIVAACGDSITGIDWSAAVPDTVLLYSLSDAEHFRMPSAYDFVFGGSVIVELTAGDNWDVAVANDLTTFSFLMPGALEGQTPTSSILAIDDTPFDAIESAPTEGYDSTGIAIDPAVVYVVRTRSIVDASGITCRFYAKLEPVTIDTAVATLSFRFLANPNCNSRTLVPGDS